MPRISLKPNSPEFAEHTAPETEHKCCDFAGCSKNGEHKAPKHRGLNEYYYFCLEHVQAYNKSWDYFDGMSKREIEDKIISSMYGDRPTWRYDFEGMAEVYLHKKAWQTYHYSDADPAQDTKENPQSEHGHINRNTPEFEALAIFGLEPPVTLSDIKIRYKELVKKHHPDINPGCDTSENLLKRINMAYTILKMAYEHFEKMPKRHK